MKRRWTIRHLLLGVNLSILLVPLGAVVFLQVFDAYLLRQTERQLMAESVVIGEAWRDRLLDELGVPRDEPPPFRPAGQLETHLTPYSPQIDLGYELLPAAPDATRRRNRSGMPEWRAGAAIQPLLQRAQVFNLSGARVLAADGCIVASSGSDLGDCLEHLEEVQGALAGRYTAVVRQRVSDDPPPPLTSIRRRGKLRVFTATPIFNDGRVVGAVRMSRTSVAPLEMLWAHRGKAALVIGTVLLFTPVLSYLFSHAISKPLRALTREAESMTQETPAREFDPGPIAPREMLVLSQTLNRMTAQLTERSEYILRFASNVSHELKTPLTGIRGAVELLQDQWSDMSDAERQRFLENIRADGDRMERLVSGLLRLARIQNVEEPTEAIDLASFFEELAARYGERVEVDCAGSLPRLIMNRDRLQDAVNNLVDNAVRHAEGEPVEVRAFSKGDRVEITVRDHGPGISEANRERVFDRFFTTERENGGTGLGLPIVQAIAESRNGNVDFTTGVRGTTFTLVL